MSVTLSDLLDVSVGFDDKGSVEGDDRLLLIEDGGKGRVRRASAGKVVAAADEDDIPTVTTLTASEFVVILTSAGLRKITRANLKTALA